MGSNGVTDLRYGFQTSQRKKEAASAVTLTDVDSGKLVVLTAADVAVTLPSPKDGLNYTVFVKVASAGTGATIVATSTIIIGNGANNTTTLTNSGASDAIGDLIRLESDGTNWFITDKIGTWANS